MEALEIDHELYPFVKFLDFDDFCTVVGQDLSAVRRLVASTPYGP